MFNQNVPAKFQTSHDSSYTVDAMGVTRHKPADPSRETKRQAKNIYYSSSTVTARRCWSTSTSAGKSRA